MCPRDVIRYDDNVNIFPNELIMNIIRHTPSLCGWLAVGVVVISVGLSIRYSKRNGMNGILSEFINYLFGDHPDLLFSRAFVVPSKQHKGVVFALQTILQILKRDFCGKTFFSALFSLAAE